MAGALIPGVMARLASQLPDLAGRIEGAASFTDLLARKALPQQTPALHVVPGSLRGGAASAATGIFTQALDQTVTVLLTLRTFDRTGTRAMDQADDLILGLVHAVAGWGPEEAIGVFVLSRGQLVSMQAGTLVYQLDFTLTDQLRVFS